MIISDSRLYELPANSNSNILSSYVEVGDLFSLSVCKDVLEVIQLLLQGRAVVVFSMKLQR